MKKKRTMSLLLALVIAASLFLQIPAAAVSAQTRTFPDVNAGDWYYEDVMQLTRFGIISGKWDGNFYPDDDVRRGEFIKMIAIACEYLYTYTPSTGMHWAEEHWNILNDGGVMDVVESDSNGKQTEYPLIKKDYYELEKYMNRYEMAYLINRVLYTVYYENPMELKSSGDSFVDYINDYDAVDLSYRGSVEQVYMKVILTGYTDGTFRGDKTLSRAEAAAVIMRLLYGGKRKMQTFAQQREMEAIEDPNFESFALRYRSMTTAERRLALFGNANKTYFASSADAGSNIVTVTVKTWDINSNGAKYTRTWPLPVHKLVAREVELIFSDIYNDPEKFPIYALGGARYSDTLRHSWGCAIDINPNENYYINYRTGQTVGSFCYKNGSSPYCITPNSSVVRAFAKYGWGWGGQGWSTAADYMHFSILSSGG
ncbi:MAG: hypothetical protein GX847_06630 [Clostridiales bacterium]|nr:hypothetical protein [Clostridiales bacterium]